MLKPLVDWVAGFLFLARETRQNSEALKRLQTEVDDLAKRVEELAIEVRYVSERDRLEREKLMLQMENAFLKLQRALPDPKSKSRKRKN